MFEEATVVYTIQITDIVRISDDDIEILMSDEFKKNLSNIIKEKFPAADDVIMISCKTFLNGKEIECE